MRTAKQLYHYLLITRNGLPMSTLRLSSEILYEYMPIDPRLRCKHGDFGYLSDLLSACGEDVTSHTTSSAFHSGKGFYISLYPGASETTQRGGEMFTRFRMLRQGRYDPMREGVTPLPVILRCLDTYHGKYVRLRRAFAAYLERRLREDS